MVAATLKRTLVSILVLIGSGLWVAALLIMAQTVQQSAHFSDLHPFIVGVNVAGLLVLLILIGGRLAQLRKVTPDGEQRLLRRVLGEIDVAQDPLRHGMEAVADGDGEARERLRVTALRPDHEVGIHVSPSQGRSMLPHHLRAARSAKRLNLRARYSSLRLTPRSARHILRRHHEDGL